MVCLAVFSHLMLTQWTMQAGPPRTEKVASKPSLVGQLQSMVSDSVSCQLLPLTIFETLQKLDDTDRRSTKSTARSIHSLRDRGKLATCLPGFNRFAARRQNSKSST